MSSDPDQRTQQRPPLAEATAAADSARNRGQSAWAISSALAGALIAGGVLTNTPDRPGWAQGLVLAAILAWIVTATWFISAVSGIDPIQKMRDAKAAAWAGASRRKHAPIAVQKEPSSKTALQRVQADRLAIDKQLESAYGWTLLAILLTVAALIAGLISSVVPAHISASVTLEPKTLAKVRSMCPAVLTSTNLKGSVERGSLTRPFVVIVLDKGQCEEKKSVTIEVPPSAVDAFRSR